MLSRGFHCVRGRVRGDGQQGADDTKRSSRKDFDSKDNSRQFVGNVVYLHWLIMAGRVSKRV